MAIQKTNINELNEKNYAEFDLGLLCEDKYKDLKHIDMVVYTILNNQHGLSIKTTMAGSKRFVDKNGYVFISIGQDKLCKVLRTTRPTLSASIKRLESAELIQVVSLGNMKCNRIYVGKLERTITLGDYMKELNISENEEADIVINTVNIKDIKKATTFAEVEAGKKSKVNNSICDIDNNNVSSKENKEEIVANKLTEVEKAIKESNVNIKKTDLKECNETFTDIDVLVKALGLMESKNSHGIKALRGAYKQVMGLVTPSNKGYLNNNTMMINGKRLSDYTAEEFNSMVQEKQSSSIEDSKQKVFKPTYSNHINTPKVEGESFK